MNAEDRSIANAVRQLKAKHPAISVELAQDIGEAILEERRRCAALANKYRHETLSLMSMPPQSAAAAAIGRAILSGEPI
ncbi:hypothetical protein N7376_22055 [Brucella intermedia GD04153]|uniref:Uncharacterized protein n=1 Tax=Brucella intermedia GD04153 TaxID=2975438 RepID=A0AA42H0Z8_9HYPH|nr:hypothetical protein [Brucella intermedia]MDH0126663.1 hypothetical protein [Brucella intermedia GD04153]